MTGRRTGDPRAIPDPGLRIAFADGSLRAWRKDDADALVRHADDREVWRNLGDRFPHPYTQRDARRWLAGEFDTGRELALAIEVGGEAAGGLGIKFWSDPIFRYTAELGYWLGRVWWGRGIMSRAIGALVPWAFERLDLVRIEAGVFDRNAASARVLEKSGFRLEARLERSVIKEGQILDRLLYVRFRD